MYTIRQASERSGVSTDLLRAWERRYGIVEPKRSGGGYRLYDDDGIERLRAMRRLVDAGWPASRAAEEVASRGARPYPSGSDAGARAAEPSSAGHLPDQSETEPESAFVASAIALDPLGLEAALDTLFEGFSFEAVIDDRVLPAVAALGRAWLDGRLDIAGEHLASAAVLRRLATRFDLAAAPGNGPGVVVGLPPGGRHEIGALAFAIALRRRGLDVLYLGADVPVTSWERAVLARGARAAVIAIARADEIPAAREVARRLAETRPPVLVAVGGPEAAGASEEGGAVLLASRVGDAAADLARLIGPGGG